MIFLLLRMREVVPCVFTKNLKLIILLWSELTGRLAWSRRSTVGWVCDPYLERNVIPKGGQANWPPSLGPWGPASLGQTSLHYTEGACPPPEAQPGSPIAPRGPPARLREGNQAPEQMADPPAHESGGGGYLAPSRWAARATTTRAHAPARRWSETWAQKYQDHPILGRIRGDGNNPDRAQACARAPERGWSLGLFSSVLFSTSFKQKKKRRRGNKKTRGGGKREMMWKAIYAQGIKVNCSFFGFLLL